ncbi:transcription factor IIIB 90 kDa subunit-like [Babylonia areolata]|uniref:transcription factor IIIB 90 kDa subunit-like n=1 Tax=Babylonia areolata TaxID=304850 RepID=UPI003FD5B3B0
MADVVCTNCGSRDIVEDEQRNEKVCTDCGNIVEADCQLSAEVQFEEGRSGQMVAQGQFVSHVRAIIRRVGQNRMEPRLSERQCSSAEVYFKLARRNRLTQHRRHVLVAGACIYIVCRLDGLPDILFHFLVDVFALGRMFVHIARGLHQNISLCSVDPCLYMERYANVLEFGERQKEVCRSALRLVQRMKRDWMHTGRKPAGLCGAALLVAARMHDFNRTLKEMISVVRVCKATIRKRLMEFGDTPTGQMSVEEFDSADLDRLEEQDPPSFRRARKRLRLREELDEEVSGQIEVCSGRLTSPSSPAKPGASSPPMPVSGQGQD